MNFNFVAAETDKVISQKEIKEASIEHRDWLEDYLKKLKVNFENEKELGKKLNLVTAFKSNLSEYFKKNEEYMITDLRLEYRSLRDLYLVSIPESKYFKKENCSIYWSRFQEGAGVKEEHYTWSSVYVVDMLNGICPTKD